MPAKKFGFSRASGFEDFRDRLMEQLAVGSAKILGVNIAKSNLCIVTGTGVLGAETTRFKRLVCRRSFNALADLP
jgi:hypothetical protein